MGMQKMQLDVYVANEHFGSLQYFLDSFGVILSSFISKKFLIRSLNDDQAVFSNYNIVPMKCSS